MCTTENAFIRRHGFKEGLLIGFETGTMVRRLDIWLARDGKDVITPPADLNLPALPEAMDALYLNALYDLLTGAEDDPGNLAAAIRWLELAWMNTEMLEGARILALRSGFEAAFNSSDTEKVRSRFSKMFDSPNAGRTLRAWGRFNDVEECLTDLEWWFQSFTLLRNKIAHGKAIQRSDVLFDGVEHVFHAEYWLRRTIKRIVKNAGHSDVELSAMERAGQAAKDLIAESWLEPGVDEKQDS